MTSDSRLFTVKGADWVHYDYGDGYVISNEELKKAVQRLVADFHPQRIILFGSQARGTADERSDVDILVITPIKGNRRDLTVKMYRTLDALNYGFDILISTSEEFERDRFIPGTVARYAFQDGKVIYECKYQYRKERMANSPSVP